MNKMTLRQTICVVIKSLSAASPVVADDDGGASVMAVLPLVLEASSLVSSADRLDMTKSAARKLIDDRHRHQ